MQNQFLIEPKIKTKIEELIIKTRGPYLWNKIIIPNPCLSNFEHLLPSFKRKLKTFLLSFDDTLSYF